MKEATDEPVSPNGNTITLMLHIDAHADVDADKLGQLTGYLRSELEDMDILLLSRRLLLWEFGEAHHRGPG